MLGAELFWPPLSIMHLGLRLQGCRDGPSVVQNHCQRMIIVWALSALGSDYCMHGFIFREDLWVREGKILNPEKLFFDEKGFADIQLDCKDSIIAPGFIDVQINGKTL